MCFTLREKMRLNITALVLTASIIATALPIATSAAAERTHLSTTTAGDNQPSRPDRVLLQQIKSRMLDARAQFYADIGIDVIDGDVLLSGRVADPKDKRRASALVRSVPGVQTVTNEIHVGATTTMRQAIDDLNLERQVKTSLIRVFGKRMPRLSYRVTDGMVYVFGQANSEWEHNRALAVIKQVKGIKKVIDRLRIVPNGTAR